jgi:phosphoesterase RecJ-like protein
MGVDWAPFVDLVRGCDRVLLTTHVRPDGDGIGSMRALAEILEQQGKRVRMAVASTFPPRYQFLNQDQRIERFRLPGEEYRDTNLVVILDTGTRSQLGDLAGFIDGLSTAKVVIDHHRTQDDLHALALIDTTAEATGRLTHEAIVALGGWLTKAAASALFTAVAMDTGWFQHSNTSAATFALAAELVRAGARPDHLHQLLFEENSPGRMKLMGLVLDRLRLEYGGRVAWTEIRRADYATTGALPADSEDLVNHTRSIQGVEVGLLFMEQPAGGVKVSFRARNRVDVGKLAEQFGGGGHRLASGAIVHTSLEDARQLVLAAVEKMLTG